MTAAEIATKLEAKFGPMITAKQPDAMNPTVEVDHSAIAQVAQFCRDDDDLAFDYLRDLTAVDWMIPDDKKAKKLNIEPHLQVLYQIFSFKHKHDLTLKVRLERWKNGNANVLPEIASVSRVWQVAEWHEREAYDLMGIRFTGHPRLTRILCAEDWVGHPLRKDYEFPLEYHGVRCK